ncbi:putative DNA replication complex GINS protein PSF3 [Diplonema papillatum]|nr:putative DNA replication complex GINS protein PSF3 [Diplonema papillatum]|eukprot:gene9336-14473_t
MPEHRYYDVDTILAEDERVVVEVGLSLFSLGWLKAAGSCREQEVANEDSDQSDDEQPKEAELGTDLAKGTPVELPLWLARCLLKARACKVAFPAFYDHTFLEKLHSHPFAVNLRSEASPHYYEFARQLASSLPGGENPRRLRTALINVFTARMVDVMKASEMSGHDADEVKAKLPEVEKHLYTASIKERKAKRMWAAQHLTLVSHHRYTPYYVNAEELPAYLSINAGVTNTGGDAT